MQFPNLLLDFETYCDLPLKDVGVRKYTTHHSFRPLCMSFTEFDPETLTRGTTTRWTPDSSFKIDLAKYSYYWALNAGFDFQVYLASFKQLPFTLPMSIDYWKDVQVVLGKFSLPLGLEEAAKVVETPIQKHYDGPLIIKRCCKRNASPPTREDLEKLYLYCDQDVDATFEVLKACPSIHITESEWTLWRETFLMNYRGLPIDYEAVRAIKVRVDAYKEVICESLPDITGGKITKPTQTARIKAFLNDNGVAVANTTAETLENLVDKDDQKPFLPAACRQLIEARMAGGASSVAKFGKLIDMEVKGKVHDFIRYGATSTLRWAGAGYQVHSLPKASVADPEDLIDRFINFGEIDNPIQSAKALCRSVIKAPDSIDDFLKGTGQTYDRDLLTQYATEKGLGLSGEDLFMDGTAIYSGDFSSIEYLLLIWITDMQDKLQLFVDKKSAYIDMAAYLFDKPYESIDKYAIDNLEYFLGKQVILGCGYQMGAPKFKATCARYGVEISLAQAKHAVNGYRNMYRPIAKLWDNVHRACIAAVQAPGKVFSTNMCKFSVLTDRSQTRWLVITLPSGTKQFYHSPELARGKYGYEIKHMGLDKYKWVRKFLSPGRITENIIQRLARELMANSMLTVSRDPIFYMLMSVHDELNSLGPNRNKQALLKYYISLLERTPGWGKTIPLRAGGYVETRYKKD